MYIYITRVVCASFNNSIQSYNNMLSHLTQEKISVKTKTKIQVLFIVVYLVEKRSLTN